MPPQKALILPLILVIQCNIHRKILVGEKIGKFGESRKIHMAYALTVAYFHNFSSPIAFTCMVHQNNFPCQIFPMYGNTTLQTHITDYHIDI